MNLRYSDSKDMVFKLHERDHEYLTSVCDQFSTNINPLDKLDLN